MLIAFFSMFNHGTGLKHPATTVPWPPKHSYVMHHAPYSSYNIGPDPLSSVSFIYHHTASVDYWQMSQQSNHIL